MPFFVAIRHQARQHQRETLLAFIREDFAASARAARRKFARLFQHVERPDILMAFEEWQEREDFEAHLRSPGYREALDACGLPPQPMPLERLQYYRHMPRPPTALTCTLLASAPEDAATIEAYVCEHERQRSLAASGLVLRAVYRVSEPARQLVLLHGWQTIEDLTRYAATDEPAATRALVEAGATLDRFTGQIAAEYSWLDG